MNKKYGLVLCGGGGLGAAQIGVWQALREAGLEKNIKAVSGASVGALNAVLFAIGDLDAAKKTWYSVTPKTLLSPNKNPLDGLFSREGLINIMKETDISKIRSSHIEIYAAVHNISLHKTEYHRLNDKSDRDIITLLLASSAIIAAYGRVEYNGALYSDGSTIKSGNTPIKPLYDKGYKNIIISSLTCGFSINNIPSSISEGKIDGEKEYPDCAFTVIAPKAPADGSYINILNFSPSAIRNRMISGYNDAMAALNFKEVPDMSDLTGINIYIHKRINEIIKTESDWERFVKLGDFKHINIKTPTLGGKVFYNNIAELFGWKLQHHALPTPLTKEHYRILDKNNERRAWVISADSLIKAIDRYQAAFHIF